MARSSRTQGQGQGQQQNQNSNQNGNQNGDQNGGQPQRPARHISGPQSALTDYLASHNISARRIREEAEQRRQEAAASARQDDDDEEEDTVPVTVRSTSGRRSSARGTNGAQPSAKKKEEAKAIEKIKASKAFKKRKKDADDSDDEDAIARAIFEERHAPLPGQMENCAVCSKRFTVTPYSVAGPEGGLCCAPCGKEIAKQRQGQQPKKKQARKQAGGVGTRRAVQSRILDGDRGIKALSILCVQTLAKNVDMADSLGDLPEHLVDKIARIFSKRRLLRPETLPLFAQPSTEAIHIYDGARLSDQDFINIFQVAPKLRRFKARSAIQFKDEVMDYLLTRDTNLEYFYLHGANLLREDKWHAFLNEKGGNLRGLQVYYTDLHFGDETIALLQHTSPNLTRLKVENNQKVTGAGVEAAGDLPNLQHLGFQLQHEIHSPSVVKALTKCGSQLHTLSLKIMPLLNDTVLQSIHDHCHTLTKLRITDSEHMTDQGFANFFNNWKNPPLDYVDLQKCRHMDSTRARDNPDEVGLCDQGFKALMAHSGSKLRILNVHACRHISQQAFEEVFAEDITYPELVDLEISFCEHVTDFVLGSIFRSCPKIKKVNVFGCMKVREVVVPRGVVLIGVPNAQGMVTEGDA